MSKKKTCLEVSSKELGHCVDKHHIYNTSFFYETRAHKMIFLSILRIIVQFSPNITILIRIKAKVVHHMNNLTVTV